MCVFPLRYDAVCDRCQWQGFWGLPTDDGRKSENSSLHQKLISHLPVIMLGFLTTGLFIRQKPKPTRRSSNATPSSCWSTLTTSTRGSAEWLTSTCLAWLKRKRTRRDTVWASTLSSCPVEPTELLFFLQVPSLVMERPSSEDHAGHPADPFSVSQCRE